MQFSLFGAATAPPTLADCDGVLLGGGHWVRHGSSARLSVVVADRWRADALHDAFYEREIAELTDPIVRAEEGWAVRTCFSPVLHGHAQRWSSGANESVPADFTLGPQALRLWAITAGRTDGAGYLLATEQADDKIHTVAGAQLSRLGLAAVSLTARAGGPGWRLTSAKRLRRLAELLGEPPVGSDWPLY